MKILERIFYPRRYRTERALDMILAHNPEGIRKIAWAMVEQMPPMIDYKAIFERLWVVMNEDMTTTPRAREWLERWR